MPITLTSQQTEAVEQMLNFVTSKAEERMFLLEGYAETGKTSTWWTFYEKLAKGKQSYFVSVCAPTNKAVKVLEKMAPHKFLSKVDFATIHTTLGLSAEINHEGHKVFKPTKKYDERPSFAAYDIVLIDEASMINAELWGLLQEAMARYTHVHVIFMGDPAQLPPVNEEISPVFAHVTNRYCLTQVVRYVAEQPIGKLVDVVRSWIVEADNPSSVEQVLNIIALESQWSNTKDNRVYSLSDNDWVDSAIALFKSSEYQADSDYVRCICWTNRAVNYLNTRIRKAIYGDTDMPFVKGERLISLKPVFLSGELAISTSSEMEVVACKPGKHSDHDYQGYRVTINETQKDCEYTLFVIHESELEKWQARCNVLKARAIQATKSRKESWREYYAHLRISAPVDYAFALTAHRAQGSTFDNTFVSYRDIMRNSRQVERHKCLYVALTRARTAVYLCGVN